jgi:Flp pilus assembly pilin Flp
MNEYLKTFIRNEDGAVTVDWVVITAAVVGLGVGVVTTLLAANNSVGSRVASSMNAAQIHNLNLE